ncbi:hypothetical protein F4678DRAFT_218341 [Xylaria arbuscula]|nr:hypothetical protein F4678DRAFT_218341 [Xylaria arbuscula]
MVDAPPNTSGRPELCSRGKALAWGSWYLGVDEILSVILVLAAKQSTSNLTQSRESRKYSLVTEPIQPETVRMARWTAVTNPEALESRSVNSSLLFVLPNHALRPSKISWSLIGPIEIAPLCSSVDTKPVERNRKKRGSQAAIPCLSHNDWAPFLAAGSQSIWVTYRSRFSMLRFQLQSVRCTLGLPLDSGKQCDAMKGFPWSPDANPTTLFRQTLSLARRVGNCSMTESACVQIASWLGNQRAWDSV